jgi:polyhydroxybutyrate depolymerase
MQYATAILSTFFCAILLPARVHAAAPADLERFTLMCDGRERSYDVHYPGGKLPAEPKALVLVLHGGGGADAAEMSRRTGMNRIADREGFLVAYPMGIDGQWNDGRGKTFRRAKDNSDVDDVKFVAAVIDTLTGKRQADPNRVYVMGLSNGGMMTHRLGIELGHRLAAIAPVIANLPENLLDRKRGRALPVLIMNGTADPMMPWNGGSVRVLGKEYGTVLSTERTVRYWIDAANLPPKPKTRLLEDRSQDDHCRVEVFEYRADGNPVEVVLYRVEGGGHNLPGGNTPDRPFLLGRKCMDIDGAEVIWSFFKRHSLPNSPSKHPKEPTEPSAFRTTVADWRPKVKRIGDPKANYLNVEFTCDGKYMVWIEGSGRGSVEGIVWHCGVDQETGELIPPDGRGFRAFESTSWGRANPGCDTQGPYYVGADRNGKLILVRPEGPTRGRVTPLPTPSDARRRAIYPTCLPNMPRGFVFFIQNEKTPGAGVRVNGNSWVELQYIDLADATKVVPIERQETPRVGFAPMDVGFVRWMRGRPIVTYGARSQRTQKVEIRAFDAEQPSVKPFDLIADGHHHIDPYPVVVDGQEYIFAGVDATAKSHIYRRRAGQAVEAPFDLLKTLFPDHSRLTAPSLAQSHEPFQFQGRLYTVYQVNDRGQAFFETTFRKPGEIWLADVSGDPVRQWLIAPETAGLVAEPEPLVTPNRVWIYYSRPLIEESPLEAESGAAPKEGGTETLQERMLPKRATSGTKSRIVPRMALYRAEVPLSAPTQNGRKFRGHTT